MTVSNKPTVFYKFYKNWTWVSINVVILFAFHLEHTNSLDDFKQSMTNDRTEIFTVYFLAICSYCGVNAYLFIMGYLTACFILNGLYKIFGFTLKGCDI